MATNYTSGKFLRYVLIIVAAAIVLAGAISVWRQAHGKSAIDTSGGPRAIGYSEGK